MHLLLNIHPLVLSAVDKGEVISIRTIDLFRPAPVQFRNPWIPTTSFRSHRRMERARAQASIARDLPGVWSFYSSESSSEAKLLEATMNFVTVTNTYWPSDVY